MKGVDGTFNGTGADVYICCGFVPDFVWCVNLEDVGEQLIWGRAMQHPSHVAGLSMRDNAAAEDMASGEGIDPYEGGDTLTSTQAGTTTYGEGVYLRQEDKDWRYGTDLQPGGGSGEGDSDTISTWTLQNSSNRTGKFNEDSDSAAIHLGAGSPIMINGLWYIVTAWTAGQGEDDNEVTLNKVVPSGRVDKIYGLYGYTPVLAGQTTKPGFKIDDSTNLNVNDQSIYFHAIKFDN